MLRLQTLYVGKLTCIRNLHNNSILDWVSIRCECHLSGNAFIIFYLAHCIFYCGTVLLQVTSETCILNCLQEDVHCIIRKSSNIIRNIAILCFVCINECFCFSNSTGCSIVCGEIVTLHSTLTQVHQVSRTPCIRSHDRSLPTKILCLTGDKCNVVVIARQIEHFCFRVNHLSKLYGEILVLLTEALKHYHFATRSEEHTSELQSPDH